jgi:hypothetical protein
MVIDIYPKFVLHYNTLFAQLLGYPLDFIFRPNRLWIGDVYSQNYG